MKKILLLLVAMLATVNGWAVNYITDVMVIGGSKSEVNSLKTTYTGQGWVFIDQDLNDGCGSSSDYIYLLYKLNSDGNQNATFITDFVISTDNGTAPDSLYVGNRKYYLVAYDGSTYFQNSKGDLNSHCGSSSDYIHLYYSKEYSDNGDDYRTVKSISFNDTQSGGVPTTYGTTGYDLNSGAGGDYIYMHVDKSQGWTISKNEDGTECTITGFDSPKAALSSIIIPVSIDGAKVKNFSGSVFNGFTNLESMYFFRVGSVEQMPSVAGCSKFKHVNTILGVEISNDYLPTSMKSIAENAFSGTAIETIKLNQITNVGAHAFDGCGKLSSVTFGKSGVQIGYNAFANIHSECVISYPGLISDWSPEMYMYSPQMVITNNANWWCGWCGGTYLGSHNHLYWTLDQRHLKIDCATTSNWDSYPSEQTIITSNWNKNKVDTITLNHVYSLANYGFYDYDNLFIVDVKPGLKSIGGYAFYSCQKIRRVYLASSVTSIGTYAFEACDMLTDIYFDGNDAQWNAVEKGNYWKPDGTTAHWHCIVTFNANGHGTAPAAQNIQWSNWNKATEPAAPTADGYNFKGWYTEVGCTNQWDFYNVVPGDMTLYAKWEAVSVSVPGDVDGDGTVTAGDITALYNYLLNNNSSSIVNGDQDGDGNITAGDVTAVYNILLGNN